MYTLGFKSSTVVPATCQSLSTRRILVKARAENVSNSETSSTEQDATIFFAGNSYKEEEWKEAVAQGKVSPAPEDPEYATFKTPSNISISELMAFSGPAPEIINGRLAMLAFISAFGAEISSGQNVFSQFAEEPTGIILTFVLFSAASLIPYLNAAQREAFGPFTPEAEMQNGRAAMLGFAVLLLIEGVSGKAFF